MTKRQRIEHKQGNQERKARILFRAHNAPQAWRGYYASLGAIQDGRYTPKRKP